MGVLKDGGRVVAVAESRVSFLCSLVTLRLKTLLSCRV